MKKKILIIVSDSRNSNSQNKFNSNFLPEVAHPYARFDNAGYLIDFASLSGDTPVLHALDLAGDPDNLKFLTGKGWADMQKAVKLDTLDLSAYSAILMPGRLEPVL